MAKWSPWKKSSRLLPQWPAGGPGALVKNLTRLYVNKYKIGVDFPIKKSIIIIVKESDCSSIARIDLINFSK